jgi:perosamine synthetase
MTDLQAAVGIVQLGKLEQIIAQRRRLANRYEEAISQIASLRLPKQSEGAEPNYQSFVVETSDDSVDREALLAFMNGRDIACGPGIYPIHLQPAYAEEHREDRLPETLRAARRSFFLPLYPGMTDDEQAYVIDSLKEAFSKPPTAKEK